MSFLVAAAVCTGACERLRDAGVPVPEEQQREFERTVEQGLAGAADEWARRNRLKAAAESHLAGERVDGMVEQLESVLGLRGLGRELLDSAALVKKKLEARKKVLCSLFLV